MSTPHPAIPNPALMSDGQTIVWSAAQGRFIPANLPSSDNRPVIEFLDDDVGDILDSGNEAASDPITIPGYPYTAGSVALLQGTVLFSPEDPAEAFLLASVFEQSLDGGAVWTEIGNQTSTQCNGAHEQLSWTIPLFQQIDLDTAVGQAIQVRVKCVNGGALGQTVVYQRATFAAIVGQD